MTCRRALLACAMWAATLACAFAVPSTAVGAEACKEPETGTKHVPLISPPMASVVTGSGRLQVYAAPNPQCPMNGVFVIPRDRLLAYAQTDDGWSSVMSINPRTGDDVSGWVKSARLKATGTMGPKY